MPDQENKRKTFQEAVNEELEKRNWSAQKLSDLTGIPVRYIDAFQAGDLRRLPPAPYIRGYFIKIGEHLEIDWNHFWQQYIEEIQPSSSGAKDKMPENRFTRKTAGKWLLSGGFVVIILAAYLGYRVNNFIGKPELIVIYPDTATIITSEPLIITKGFIEPSSKLLINDERVAIQENGEWNKEFSLQPGLNSIEFKASKILGRQLTIIKQVIYNPTMPFNSSGTSQ